MYLYANLNIFELINLKMNASSLSNTHSNSTHTNVAGQNSNANNLIYNLSEGLTSRSMCALTAD